MRLVSKVVNAHRAALTLCDDTRYSEIPTVLAG